MRRASRAALCRVLSGPVASHHVIRYVMSFLFMEKAGKIAIPGGGVINAREDTAYQEERASDLSVQRKICVSVSPMFWYY